MASKLMSSISVVPCALLLFAHYRGWRWTPQALVITLIVLIIISAPTNLQTTVFISPLVPCVIAAALLSPWWAIGSFLVAFVGAVTSAALRGGVTSIESIQTLKSENLILLLMTAVGITVASGVLRSAQQAALASARQAEAERDQVELKSRELATANDQMNEQIGQQRQLLELVSTLETPVVQLADGILFSPVVGHVDTRRAQALTARLLRAVADQRARLVILDIGGVVVMDTAVAQALLLTARSLRLLGCDVMISGISAGVALTLTDLGIGLEDIKTVRSPQEALTLFASGDKLGRNGKAALFN
ncbi:MAG: STAS domain-containing protein [Roseiflexaceae bacterium]|nr:STAS domain-containing protein [Roseiflexaceae bacterium]